MPNVRVSTFVDGSEVEGVVKWWDEYGDMHVCRAPCNVEVVGETRMEVWFPVESCADYTTEASGPVEVVSMSRKLVNSVELVVRAGGDGELKVNCLSAPFTGYILRVRAMVDSWGNEVSATVRHGGMTCITPCDIPTTSGPGYIEVYFVGYNPTSYEVAHNEAVEVMEVRDLGNSTVGIRYNILRGRYLATISVKGNTGQGRGERARVLLMIRGRGMTNPPPGEYEVDVGSDFTVQATAGTLIRWEVNGVDRGNDRTLTVRVLGPTNITAVFTEGGGVPIHLVVAAIIVAAILLLLLRRR